MEEIISILKGKGFDLLYSYTTVDEYQSLTNSYMIWTKNNKYFLFECSIEGMKDLIDVDLNLWLKDLTIENLNKLIELDLPNIKSSIRENKLKKLLDK